MPSIDRKLRRMKALGQKIAALTAYDYPFAQIVSASGADLILVGDTLGPMLLGHKSIADTTTDEMIHHGRAVVRGAGSTPVIVDLPDGSYEGSSEEALAAAEAVLSGTGADAVKIEGGFAVIRQVQAISRRGWPVFGHLTAAHGRLEDLAKSAVALEEAGASAIVLVGLQDEEALRVTAALSSVPSIGFRSGPGCDGQIYVTPLLLGLVPGDDPKPGPYMNLAADLKAVFSTFVADVREGRFPPQS